MARNRNTFRKPSCRVCGLTLDDHPAQPCKRPINPQYIAEKAMLETALEAKKARRTRTGALNTKKNGRHARQAQKHTRLHNLPKRVEKKPITGKIRGNSTPSSNRAYGVKTAKTTLYKARR